MASSLCSFSLLLCLSSTFSFNKITFSLFFWSFRSRALFCSRHPQRRTNREWGLWWSPSTYRRQPKAAAPVCPATSCIPRLKWHALINTSELHKTHTGRHTVYMMQAHALSLIHGRQLTPCKNLKHASVSILQVLHAHMHTHTQHTMTDTHTVLQTSTEHLHRLSQAIYWMSVLCFSLNLFESVLYNTGSLLYFSQGQYLKAQYICRTDWLFLSHTHTHSSFHPPTLSHIRSLCLFSLILALLATVIEKQYAHMTLIVNCDWSSSLIQTYLIRSSSVNTTHTFKWKLIIVSA